MRQLLTPILYRNTSGELLEETRKVRSLVAEDGGNIVDARCLDQAIRSRKQSDSGVNTEAWTIRNRVLIESGEILSFTCLNEAISNRKQLLVG